jgi:hypothetical protein
MSATPDAHWPLLLPCQPYAMLTLATAIKLIAEIALVALLGQWLLGWMLGNARNGNPFYAVLQLLGLPWIRAVRWLSPRVVLDRHVPLVAFFLLLLAWISASFVKVSICLQIGVALCK